MSEKAIAKKIGRGALEIVGASLALIALVFGYLLWKVEHSALALNGLRPFVVSTIDKNLPSGYQTYVGSIIIRTHEADRDYYQVVVTNLAISEDNGPTKLQAPKLDFAIAKSDILHRRFGIAKVKVTNPSLTVVAPRPQPVKSKQAVTSTAQDREKIRIASLLESSQFRNILRSAEVTGLEVEFLEEGTGRRWQANSTDINLHKEEGSGFTLAGVSVLDVDGGSSPVNVNVDYVEDQSVASISLSGSKMPLGDFATFFTSLPVGAATSTVSGTLDLAVNLDGAILGADFDVTAHEGMLALGEQALEVHGVKTRGKFNPDTDNIIIDQLDVSIGQSKATLVGNIGFGTSAGKDATQELSFDLQGSDLVIDTLGLLPEIVSIQAVSLKGAFSPKKNALRLDNIDLEIDGIGINGDLLFERPPGDDGKAPPSVGFKAALKTTGKITPVRLMEVWPERLAPRSRAWVKNRITGGYAQNLDFKMDLPVGYRDEIGYIPNDNLILEFDVANTNAEIIFGLTPLSNASGHGVLRGNSLAIVVTEARLGNLKLSTGSVLFPAFAPEGGGNIIKFTGEGSAHEILSVLDEPPLGLISRGGLSPDKIDGQVSVDMVIKRPPQKEFLERRRRGVGYIYDGTATFKNLTFAEIYQDLDLSEASGTIDLTSRGMTIRGNGNLDLSPVDIVWNQRFFEADGPSDFTVNGIFDAVMADSLGYASRSILRGEVPFALEATGGYQQSQRFTLNADFNDAAFGFEQFGLSKPAGQRARAVITGEVKEGITDLSSISIKGEDIDIDGKMSFGSFGRLHDFSFSRFDFEDRASFSAEADRDENGTLNLSLSGALLDLGPAIEFALGAQQGPQQEAQGGGQSVGSFDWGDGVRASLRLDTLGLRNEVELRDTSLDFWHDSKRVQVLDLSGLDDDLDILSLMMTHSQETDGPHRAMEAQTSDLGTLFEGMFGVTSVKGGSGILRINLGSDANPGLAGTALATNLRIVEAPLLAKLFSAGSFDGLISLLNNEGIALTRASSNFSVKDGKIQFTDTKAIGPSIGITSEGAVDLNGRGEIELHGALAPAYQINSLLGNMPLIGGLLINREGEGVLALTYDIDGTVAAPAVTINPLTAFLPGVLRRAFEDNQTTPAEQESDSSDGQ